MKRKSEIQIEDFYKGLSRYTLQSQTTPWPTIQSTWNLIFFDYYETKKREPNGRLLYECRCDERLKAKAEGARIFSGKSPWSRKEPLSNPGTNQFEIYAHIASEEEEDAGARVMEGQVQIKIYDGGVENGDLTFSQGWNSEHCEDAVATVDFWGQIATYFSSVYTWTDLVQERC
jgi:hypothetical protein